MEGSAKWDDRMQQVFIELCIEEIRKGNRPGSTFNRNGWKNLENNFFEKTGKRYTHKQFKNHWDQTKNEWKLFKALCSETGLGWDERRKTIEADDDWWEKKIKVDSRFKKFRNKDLSLVWFKYDELFLSITATGERARAPSQRSTVRTDEENNLDNLDVDVDDDGREGSGDSDDVQAFTATGQTQRVTDDSLFPPSTFEQKKSSGTKRKKSGAASLKEDIQSLLQFMSTKSTASSSSHAYPSVDEGMEALDRVLADEYASEFYFFCMDQICTQPGLRAGFLKLRGDDVKYKWLQFQYQQWQKKQG